MRHDIEGSRAECRLLDKCAATIQRLSARVTYEQDPAGLIDKDIETS